MSIHEIPSLSLPNACYSFNMHCFSTLVTLLAAGSYVAAHGYVSSLTSDGQTESGWLPYEDP